MGKTVRAVERALDILSCFSRQTPQLTMSQIADRVGMNKSTVHRLLATLEDRRFLERDPATGAYRPGLHLVQLAYLPIEHNTLRQLAEPFLRRLCDQHRETITLSELEGNSVVYLDVIESPQRVKLAAAPGERLPACCTASGKAFLAFLPDETVERILAQGTPQYTPHTLQSAEAYWADLLQTRERGFAISMQEFEEGINAVAAPILDLTQHPMACVAMAGPSYRLTQERMLEIGPLVLATAREIASQVPLAGSSLTIRQGGRS